jgi:peptidoglycan/LPS O-acetylase OafA/YrhL
MTAMRAVGVGPATGLAIGRLGYSLVAWWLVGRAAIGFPGRFGRFLESAPLRYIGRISYGLYVIHAMVPPLAEWCRYRLGTSFGCPGEPGLAQLLYVTAVSIGLASLSWRYLESPLNGLKRFFPYVTRSSTVASGVGGQSDSIRRAGSSASHPEVVRLSGHVRIPARN